MISAIIIICIAIGCLFMLITGIALIRLPDIYTRMSGATKATTLGVGFILLAFALHFGELGVAARALATFVFILITAPIAAHMIGRAAYLNGVPLWEKSVCDELFGYYDAQIKRSPDGARRSTVLPVIKLPPEN